MKKLCIFLIGLLILCSPAFAATRDSRKLRVDTVSVVGAETVQSFGKSLSTSMGDGGSAVQLSSTSIPCNEAIVCASGDNVNVVYVGGSAVDANWRTGSRLGVPLGMGTSVDRCATFRVDNVNKLYGAAFATGDKVTVTYLEFT